MTSGADNLFLVVLETDEEEEVFLGEEDEEE